MIRKLIFEIFLTNFHHVKNYSNSIRCIYNAKRFIVKLLLFKNVQEINLKKLVKYYLKISSLFPLNHWVAENHLKVLLTLLQFKHQIDSWVIISQTIKKICRIFKIHHNLFRLIFFLKETNKLQPFPKPIWPNLKFFR